MYYWINKWHLNLVNSSHKSKVAGALKKQHIGWESHLYAVVFMRPGRKLLHCLSMTRQRSFVSHAGCQPVSLIYFLLKSRQRTRTRTQLEFPAPRWKLGLVVSAVPGWRTSQPPLLLVKNHVSFKSSRYVYYKVYMHSFCTIEDSINGHTAIWW
jgi:hypothetical protein